MGALTDGLNAFQSVDNIFRQRKLDGMREQQFAQQQEQANVQGQLNKQTAEMNNLKIDKYKTDLELADFKAWAPGFLARADKKQNSAEDYIKLSSYKHLGLDMGAMTDPEYGYHLDVPGRVLKGEQELNAPETIESLNKVWGPRVKRGVGEKTKDGHVIVDKRIKQVFFDKEKEAFALELEVLDDTGKWEAHPATENRSSNAEEDPYVAFYSMDDVMKNLSAQQVISKSMDFSGVRDQVKASLLGQLYAADPKHANALALQDARHKDKMEEIAAKGSGKKGGSSGSGGDWKEKERFKAKIRQGEAAAEDAGKMADDPENGVSDEEAGAIQRLRRGVGTKEDKFIVDGVKTRKLRQEMQQAFINKSEQLDGFFGSPSQDDVIKEINMERQKAGQPPYDWALMGVKQATETGNGEMGGTSKPPANPKNIRQYGNARGMGQRSNNLPANVSAPDNAKGKPPDNTNGKPADPKNIRQYFLD